MPCNDDSYRHFKGIIQHECNTNFDYNYESDVIRYLESHGTGGMPKWTCCMIYLLHHNKSPGIDCIALTFLKHCRRKTLSDDIAQISNCITEPSLKHGPKGCTAPFLHLGPSWRLNYRGITVLPIFEKIFEIAEQKRLEFVGEAF